LIIHRIPKRLKGIIFDMDGTLYDNPAYMEHQVETQVRRWAETRGMAYEAAKAELEAWMEAERQRTGAKTSLGNALAAHGVDIATSVAWRAELIKPEACSSPIPPCAPSSRSSRSAMRWPSSLTTPRAWAGRPPAPWELRTSSRAS